MHIVLHDAISIGHHPTYIRLFAQTLLRMGHSVTVLYPAPEHLNGLANDYSKLSVVKINEEKSDNSRWAIWQRWRSLKTQISKTNTLPDLVFLCWADSFRFRKDHPILDKFFLFWMNWFFPFRWSGLYFHPTHLRIATHRFNQYKDYKIDSVMGTRNCVGIAVLDEGISTQLEKICQKSVVFFPDITDINHKQPITETANRILQLAAGRKIVSITGILQKRKGVLGFLAAIPQMPNDKFFFVLAGPLVESDYNQEELKQIRDAQKKFSNLFCHFEKLVDGHEFNSIVKVSDVLYAVYNNFPHSSNIMTKAAFFEKPLLVNTGFLMEERVKKYHTGLSTSENNLQEIISQLSILADFKAAPLSYSLYFSLHNEMALQNSWKQLLSKIK